MKARPKLKVNNTTAWVGRRGGSWYNKGVILPALSEDYPISARDNHVGFRTSLTHRTER
jgi:hypothetical protein